MKVLSNEEIKSIYYNEPGDYYDLARAIEAAVLGKFTIDGHFYASNTGSLPLPEAYAGEPDTYPLYRLRETE